MGTQRYARVTAFSKEGRQLGAFLAARRLDLEGRPHQTEQGWVVAFYLPEQECAELAAEGCDFRVDRDFFDRLHRDHVRDQRRKPSDEQLAALKQKRQFHAHPRDEAGRLVRSED